MNPGKFADLIALLLIVFLLNMASAKAQSLRPTLLSNGSELLNAKISDDEFLKRARADKTQEEFNAEEKVYLEDLSRKLPVALRAKVCPDINQGLCAGDLPEEDNWEDIPALPTAQQPTPSWWSQNSSWVLWGLAAVAAAAAANSLHGKEIQFSRAR